MTLGAYARAYWIASRVLRGRDSKPSGRVAVAALRSMAHRCLHAALRVRSANTLRDCGLEGVMALEPASGVASDESELLP